jgi:hypothetical protein
VKAEVTLQLSLGFRHRPFIETRQDNVRIISANPNYWDRSSNLNFEMPKPENNFRILFSVVQRGRLVPRVQSKYYSIFGFTAQTF